MCSSKFSMKVCLCTLSGVVHTANILIIIIIKTCIAQLSMAHDQMRFTIS